MAEQDDFLSDDSLTDYDQVLPENRDNRWELDFEADLSEFRYSWRNRIDEKAIEFIISSLRSILNKSNALSNLKDEHINQIGKNFNRALALQLLLKGKRWRISNEDKTTIISQTVNLTVTHLRRAYKDGERKYRSNAYNVNLDDDTEPPRTGGSGWADMLKRRVNKDKRAPKEELDEGMTEF